MKKFRRDAVALPPLVVMAGALSSWHPHRDRAGHRARAASQRQPRADGRSRRRRAIAAGERGAGPGAPSGCFGRRHAGSRGDHAAGRLDSRREPAAHAGPFAGCGQVRLHPRTGRAVLGHLAERVGHSFAGSDAQRHPARHLSDRHRRVGARAEDLVARSAGELRRRQREYPYARHSRSLRVQFRAHHRHEHRELRQGALLRRRRRR